MNKTLVLFDFDGTITKRDTFIQFILFSEGYLKGIAGSVFFSPFIILYFLKIVDGTKLKQKLVSFYFKGKSEKELKDKGNKFIGKLTEENGFRNDILEQLRGYKEKNAVVCVVSASLDIWIEPFCKKFNIEYLCTGLDFRNDVCTGEFKGLNCNNAEKAVRIKGNYNLQSYSKIIAYGNGNGDKEMFELASETFLV
mgnify:CR=1 FL=1